MPLWLPEEVYSGDGWKKVEGYKEGSVATAHLGGNVTTDVEAPLIGPHTTDPDIHRQRQTEGLQKTLKENGKIIYS